MTKSDTVFGGYGVWLRALRSRMGISQAQFGKRTGISTQHQKLLEGGYRCPGPTLLLLQNMMADNVAFTPAPECTAPRKTLRDHRT